jgi:hypothetical protein
MYGLVPLGSTRRRVVGACRLVVASRRFWLPRQIVNVHRWTVLNPAPHGRASLRAADSPMRTGRERCAEIGVIDGNIDGRIVGRHVAAMAGRREYRLHRRASAESGMRNGEMKSLSIAEYLKEDCENSVNDITRNRI